MPAGFETQVIIIASAPTGRLIQNTHLHERYSVRNPPRSGPNARKACATPTYIAIAFPLSLMSKDSMTIAAEEGSMSAAPRPWSARAAIITPSLGARPQSAEAIAKTTTPVTNARTLPKMSPSFPPNATVTASASTYAFTIHSSPVCDTARSD